MVQAAKKANIKKFIYAASASCYGIPDKFPTKENTKTDPMYPYAFRGQELQGHMALYLEFF